MMLADAIAGSHLQFTRANSGKPTQSKEARSFFPLRKTPGQTCRLPKPIALYYGHRSFTTCAVSSLLRQVD